MSGTEDLAGALQVLEHCLSGEVPVANAIAHFTHIHRTNPRVVLAALSEKVNTVVANADTGPSVSRAGALIVNIADALDKSADAGGPQKKAVSRALLDHVLLLTGGQARAAKDKAIRAQGCAMVAALVPAAPTHEGAEAKLVEFALDKVPSIREKAVRGLAAMSGSLKAEQALMGCATDPFAAVRASAVFGLPVSRRTAPALLERIDDVEACVRAQLFHRLAERPEAIETFGPAALARLVAGLTDRSASVRAAAGGAVDVWHKRLGGVLPLLTHCDVLGDEALGECVAGALMVRFPGEGAAVAQRLMCHGRESPDGHAAIPPALALLGRLAIKMMGEADRDKVVDPPLLLQCTHTALETAQRRDACSGQNNFVLRQLLHIVASLDICDEVVRRKVDKLAEAVIVNRPSSTSEICQSGSKFVHSATDLGIVILRRCYGLGAGYHASTGSRQALEASFSTRVILLVSDLCIPLDSGEDDGDGESADTGCFTSRLSLRLEGLNTAIEKCVQLRGSLAAQKKKAVADEEFIEAQRIKDSIKKNDKELDELRREHSWLKTERDNVCLRVLGIINSLLRWSNSVLRRDPALFGTLDQILRPLVSLPALTEEVEVAAVSAICIFCVRDGACARSHWSLLMELLRQLRQFGGERRQQPAQRQSTLSQSHLRARAAVAAHTLSDCARVHGENGDLDRAEMLSAANALAAVPFWARHVAIEPLCGWLLSLGNVFFEEHLHEPVLEVQWGLGWMLVETFKQRGKAVDDEDSDGGAAPSHRNKAPKPSGPPKPEKEAAAKVARNRGTSWVTRPTDHAKAALDVHDDVGEDDEEENDPESVQLAAQLVQFFALLPKLPGKHGAPMLSLAVESIAESGLWRRAVLLPRVVDGQTRWLRGFSWPQLFAFAHARLPPELRFRLWRCSLQICVASPGLAPFAEVPAALTAAAGDAPPGAAEMVREAVSLGADADVMATLIARLPPAAPTPQGEAAGAGSKFLMPRAEAEAAERDWRTALADLGIEVDVWAPANIEVPEIAPPHHRMRIAKGRGGKCAKADAKAKAQANWIPLPPPAALADDSAQPAAAQPEVKRRRCVAKCSEKAAEAPAQDQVHLPLRDLGDIN